MKKNVDQMTADLYNATKTAYLREFSGIIRNNAKCQPVTVDMMAQLVNGRSMDGLALAEGTDTKKVIDLMPGYSCGLASLPRIYKQVARMAGETCEKITITDTLPPFGITAEAAADKHNKKIVSLLKKVCKRDELRNFPGYVYHDAARRCAVWTDAHALILSRSLYNPAAAGLCVDAQGLTPEYIKYPNYGPAIPDFNDCQAVNSDTVINNCAAALTAAKNIKKTYGNADTIEIFNACMINGQPVGISCEFLPFLKLIESNIYAITPSRPLCGYLHNGDGFILLMPRMVPDFMALDKNTVYCQTEAETTIKKQVPEGRDSSAEFRAYLIEADSDKPTADAADVVEVPAADAVTDADPDKKNLTPGTIIDYYEYDYTAAGIIIAGPIYKENIDSWQYIAIKEYGTMSIVAADNITNIIPCQDADTAADMVEYAKQQRVACMRRVKKVWSENLINYINIVDDYEAAQDAAADAATPEPTDETPAAPTVTDADVLAQAARIKAIYDDLQAEADSQPAGMSCDDLPDNTPIYTADDVEKMIEAATADTYTADEVAEMVAAAVAEERARHTRRRFAPRLRPVLRRLGRVAAVVLPLLIVALFIGASTDSTASAPAADAAAVTTCQAAETVAQVVELPAVTVTAAAVTDAPATPSPVKKLATPSPVKKAAADAVTLPGQKTASALATATAPAADNADSLTTAPAANGLQPTPPDGLTICAGTAWAYTMMNWA